MPASGPINLIILKIMCLTGIEQKHINMQINDKTVEWVDEFVYLGQIIQKTIK